MRVCELLRRNCETFWRGLRLWSGDAAYEIYLRNGKRVTEQRILSKEEFYVEQLNRKYSRPNRCC